MKKALVTGGAGFIGSHLADRLLEKGYRVIVIDNLSTGRLENLARHKGNKAFSLHRADISRLDEIMPFFENVDIAFHIAGLADIVPSITRPLDYFQSNIAGTTNVIESCRNMGVGKLIYAASSSCYGIPEEYPTSEAAAIRPQYPYALTKYLGEEIVMHWAQVYKIPVISLRLFNVYGPRSRTSGTYGAVFGVFLAQKLNKKPFTVVGDGTQTRDFTYISDVVEAFIAAAESGCQAEIMNVGSGNTCSINRLVEILGGEKVYIPRRPGEPDCTRADISKIKALLGWSPKVSLEEGIEFMFDNIHYWENAPVWSVENIKEATKDWFHYLAE